MESSASQFCGGLASALRFAVLLVTAAQAATLTPVVHDLISLHGAARVLVNPHKCWHNHSPDSPFNQHIIARDADLLGSPGIDHFYSLLACLYLNPREEGFDRAGVEQIFKKRAGDGLGIAFCIICKAASIDWLKPQPAAPRWLVEAAAQSADYWRGVVVVAHGPWELAWDDPDLLAKLDKCDCGGELRSQAPAKLHGQGHVQLQAETVGCLYLPFRLKSRFRGPTSKSLL